MEVQQKVCNVIQMCYHVKYTQGREVRGEGGHRISGGSECRTGLGGNLLL